MVAKTTVIFDPAVGLVFSDPKSCMDLSADCFQQSRALKIFVTFIPTFYCIAGLISDKII